jgi:hypothetical protein
MVDISVSLIGANGDTISLDETSDYVLMTGLLGFGIPATQVRLDQSASDGGVWRNTKRGIRNVDLPIAVFGSSRDDVEVKLRRLTRLLNDTSSATTIRATYATGESWDLGAHYVGGAESQYGDSAGETWIKWTLSFQAPDPFWTRTSSESYSLSSGVTGRGLIPNLAELRLSSSQAIGVLEIENPGDVSSFPRWQFEGPMDTITVTSASGQVFSYEAAIAAGSKIFVDTYRGTVVDQTGANQYANLGSSPKLFQIPAGSSTLNVSATGATSATTISMFFQPRKEIVH